LRAGRPPAAEYEHAHSAISESLFCRIIDAEYRFSSRLAYMTAFAALHGGIEGDGRQKAGDIVNNLYYDALYELPYITGGVSGEDIKKSERDKLIAKYEAMQPKLREAEKVVKVEKVKPIKVFNKD
jgi:hypothetical protein